jgi:hypothetical protein
MSFPRYPKYKESGVEWLGQVPEHWDVKRIGYYFVERREKVSDKDFPALSVTKNGIVPQLDTAAKSDDGDNRKKVLKGDFVINSRSDRKGFTPCRQSGAFTQPALNSAMFIIGLGTATPPQRYAQRDAWGALQNWPKFSQLKPRSKAILKKVLCGDNGIDTRHLALETLAEVFDQTPDDLQARFATTAVGCNAKTACAARRLGIAAPQPRPTRSCKNTSVRRPSCSAT